jgi:hypothetical protein
MLRHLPTQQNKPHRRTASKKLATSDFRDRPIDLFPLEESILWESESVAILCRSAFAEFCEATLSRSVDAPSFWLKKEAVLAYIVPGWKIQ